MRRVGLVKKAAIIVTNIIVQIEQWDYKTGWISTHKIRKTANKALTSWEMFLWIL